MKAMYIYYEKIKLKIIESYHHDLGNQSWLAIILIISKLEIVQKQYLMKQLNLILAYMEDDYADL